MRIRECFGVGNICSSCVRHKLSSESELILFKKKCTRETYSHVLKNVMPRRSTSSSFVLLLHRVFLLFCTKLYFTLLYSRLLTP